MALTKVPSAMLSDYVTPEDFGAVGDGVTDDLVPFEAADTAGVSPVFLSTDYFLSTDTTGKNVSYTLASDASVTLGAGNWNPRRYYKDGVTPYDRKVNFTADNPTVPPEAYALLADSYQSHSFWINQWGYQEPDTNGDYSGSFNGPFPGGQTRLARTGAYQVYWQGNHSGEGDGYNHYSTMASTPSGATPITYWSGQNSSGLFGGQVSALGAKTNLYGQGDVVLKDMGYSDVSMLGYVNILTRTGADSGSYSIPRFNYLAVSNGTGDVDAAYGADGAYVVGMDLSQATVSSSYAITLGTGQRIGFDAAAPAAGKFTSASGGTYYMVQSGTALTTVAGGNATTNTYADRFTVKPNAESAHASRVYGSSATAYASVGQIGLLSYVMAASSGTDSTQLLFMTASGGTEAEAARIKANGVVKLTLTPTYADDTAAGSGGLVAGDVYQTATGELRIKT